MPEPSEHKTVQARILKYADEIGWTVVSREEAERRKSFFKEYKTKRGFIYKRDSIVCLQLSSILKICMCICI